MLLRGHLANGGYSICSATIIAPTLAITAAHCVDPATVGSVTGYDVFIGDDLATQGNDSSFWLAVTDTAYDSAFDPQALQLGHDVGIAILSAPTSLLPVPINRSPLTAASMGAPLRVVGFGITNAGDVSGATVGIRRVVTTPLSSYDALFVNFGTNGANTCEGDSGGPALLDVGGTLYIAGLTSFGPANCGGQGSDTRADTVGYAFAANFLPLEPADMATNDLARPPTMIVAPATGGGDVEALRSGCAVAGDARGDGSLALCLLLALVALRAQPLRRSS